MNNVKCYFYDGKDFSANKGYNDDMCDIWQICVIIFAFR